VRYESTHCQNGHDSPLTGFAAHCTAEIRQKPKHMFYERCDIHLLSFRENSNLVMISSIEEDCGDAVLPEM
jgi:hypothetical protein